MFQLGRLLLVKLHFASGVGLDAPLVRLTAGARAVNVLAAGPPVTGDRQLQQALAAFQRNHVLNRALAPGALANAGRPVVVLQAGGHDFAGAGALAVD
jgi:hypothetical protein